MTRSVLHTAHNIRLSIYLSTYLPIYRSLCVCVRYFDIDPTIHGLRVIESVSRSRPILTNAGARRPPSFIRGKLEGRPHDGLISPHRITIDAKVRLTKA